MGKRTFEDRNEKQIQEAMIVNCKRLRIRQAPSLEAKVLEYVPSGEMIDVVGSFNHSTFARVQTKHGTKGYAVKAYLEMTE